MLRQSKGNSLKSRVQVILQEIPNVKTSPRKKFKLNSKMIKHSIEKYVNQTSRYHETYEYTSEKLRSIYKNKYQIQKEYDFVEKIRLFTKPSSKVITQQAKNKDRFQIYCKILQPKTLKNPMSSLSSSRKRTYSTDDTPRLPPLLMTFGKFS